MRWVYLVTIVCSNPTEGNLRFVKFEQKAYREITTSEHIVMLEEHTRRWSPLPDFTVIGCSLLRTEEAFEPPETAAEERWSIPSEDEIVRLRKLWG